MARTTTTTSTTAPTTTTPVAPPRFEGRFDRVVDVAAAGADAGGSRDAAGVVEAVAGDDTLLLFPPGTYALSRLKLTDYANLGFVGDPPGEAQFRPTRPASEIDNRFLQFRDVSDFVFEGIELDYARSDRGGAVMVLADGDFAVRDVRIRGKMPDRSHPDNPAAYRFDVLDGDARGTVERIVARDGGHDGGNAVGIYVGKDHAGELVFTDCDIQQFPNNGLYASSPGRETDEFYGADGVVHVRGGLFRNNNIANVRLGTTDSTVRGTRVVVDAVPPHPNEANLNVRGIRLRGQHGQVVEDCEIVVGPDAGPGFGGIVFHPANGRATVRNTVIRMDRDDVHAIRVFPPSVNEPFGSLFENVTVTGAAGGGETVLVTARQGMEFRNCTIEQSGDERAGMLFVDATDCSVADSTIDVTGTPIQSVNSTVRTRNVTVVDRRETTTDPRTSAEGR